MISYIQLDICEHRVLLNNILWSVVKFRTQDTMNIYFKAVVCKLVKEHFCSFVLLCCNYAYTQENSCKSFNVSFGCFVPQALLEVNASIATCLSYNASGLRNEVPLIDCILRLLSRFSIFSASRFLWHFFKTSKNPLQLFEISLLYNSRN